MYGYGILKSILDDDGVWRWHSIAEIDEVVISGIDFNNPLGLRITAVDELSTESESDRVTEQTMYLLLRKDAMGMFPGSLNI